ncbi:MAG: pseudouridine-5'-phosphate glycosidase [Mycobacteriaceae bacterium]
MPAASTPPPPVRLHAEVGDALAEGRAVVALESTLLAHGLPRPGNLATARQLEAVVREQGAVPATIAVLDGVARVGLGAAELERVCGDDTLAKLSTRDLPVVLGTGGSGATTVASTAVLAQAAGVRVFATGGLGGVHRGASASFDESADLTTLSRTRIVVVCAGVKSILDVPATLERLESLSVTVVGYRTHTFPGFYVTDSGSVVHHRCEDPAELARVFAAGQGLSCAALVVANPLPAELAMDPAEHDAAITEALGAADVAGVSGKEITPFVLDHLHTTSNGRTREVNVTLVLRNAALAAQVAVALAVGQA